MSGALGAIIKFDGPESPHCVYNEQVALRLAQTLHVPVANGALVSVIDGPAYASLEVAETGIALPNVHKGQYKAVAEAYPDAAAAIVAFDIWIGNTDRHENIKASLVVPEMPLFLGFDHSHCLLTIAGSPSASIRELRVPNALIADFHPFFHLVEYDRVAAWVERIALLDSIYVDECCRFGRQFRGVSERVQASLANALKERAKNLPRILYNGHPLITGAL